MATEPLSRPSVYEARWRNAVRWAKQVNKALELGHLVFVGEGTARMAVEAPIQILDNRTIFGPFSPGDNSGTIWFIDDPELDMGSHDDVDDWNRRHATRCYAPVPVPVPDLDETEGNNAR